jgi:multidrug efflux pump subunit AcrA (membrane-fusion protein)
MSPTFGRIALGRPVTFKVDAFPKDIFRGVVTQIRMNPAMVQNVVTYDVIVAFANPELKLFPGMTAYVTIPVATTEKRAQTAEHRVALQATARAGGASGAVPTVRH